MFVHQKNCFAEGVESQEPGTGPVLSLIPLTQGNQLRFSYEPFCSLFKGLPLLEGLLMALVS
jgi:hypothetical protein